MARSTTLIPLVCILSLLSVLVSPPSARGTPPQTPQAARATPENLTATVRALDTKAHTLDVITGVGYASRLIKVHVDPACQIRAAGAPAQLGDLKPGHIVRIQYRKSQAGILAEKIESIEADR